MKPGERVVIGANFIVDSESRLKGAFAGMGAPSQAPKAAGAGAAIQSVSVEVLDPKTAKTGMNSMRLLVRDASGRRAFGGTSGMLKIGQDSIQFVSEKPPDSRTWLYRDIETIGRPDSFRFRVSTNRETYVLELKNALPEPAYQFAWSKVYNLERSGR